METFKMSILQANTVSLKINKHKSNVDNPITIYTKYILKLQHTNNNYFEM